MGLRVSKLTGHILSCWVSPFSSSLWLAWSHTSPLLMSFVLWNLLLDVKKCYTAALRHPATSCFPFGAVSFRAFVSPKGGRGQSGNRKVKYGYGDGQCHSLWASFGLSRNLWVSFAGSLFHTVRDYGRLDAAIVWRKKKSYISFHTSADILVTFSSHWWKANMHFNAVFVTNIYFELVIVSSWS